MNHRLQFAAATLLTPLVVGTAGYFLHNLSAPALNAMIEDAAKRGLIEPHRPHAKDFSGTGRTTSYLAP